MGDQGKFDTAAQLQRLFYTSTEDRNRAQIGLPPMPKPVPPPPPPSKERTQEILNDDRVKVRANMNVAAIAHLPRIAIVGAVTPFMAWHCAVCTSVAVLCAQLPPKQATHGELRWASVWQIICVARTAGDSLDSADLGCAVQIW